MGVDFVIGGVFMLQKLEAGNHAQPFRGPFTITRVQPGDILGIRPQIPHLDR